MCPARTPVLAHLPLSKSLSREPEQTGSRHLLTKYLMYSSSAISTNRSRSEVVASHPVLLPLALFLLGPPRLLVSCKDRYSGGELLLLLEAREAGVQLPSSEYVRQIGHKREQ